MSTSELATSYAVLMLADDGVEITADHLKQLITAAKIDKIDDIFPELYAKALEGKDVKKTMAEIDAGNGADLHPAAFQDKCSAAQCLLATGGNNSPSPKDLKHVLGVVASIKAEKDDNGETGIRKIALNNEWSDGIVEAGMEDARNSAGRVNIASRTRFTPGPKADRARYDGAVLDRGSDKTDGVVDAITQNQKGNAGGFGMTSLNNSTGADENEEMGADPNSGMSPAGSKKNLEKRNKIAMT